MIELEINIRVLEETEDDIYGIDGSYPYDDVSFEEFFGQIYPNLIKELEETFHSSQLQYYQPEGL